MTTQQEPDVALTTKIRALSEEINELQGKLLVQQAVIGMIFSLLLSELEDIAPNPVARVTAILDAAVAQRPDDVLLCAAAEGVRKFLK